MFPTGMALAEGMALVGGIDPASQAAATYTTGPINTALHNRLLFVLNAGVLGGGGSLQLSILASTTSGGSYAAVAGLTAAPLCSVSGNKVLYEVRADVLQNTPVGPWVKGQVVVAGATCAFSLEVFAGLERYYPASDYNEAAVQAVVLN